MPRPLMQLKITQLEELFAASKVDTKTLKALEGELQHRHVPRAVALLDKVQKALKASKSEPTAVPADTPASRQPELWSGPENLAPRTGSTLAAAQPRVSWQATSPASESTIAMSVMPASGGTDESTTMSVDDAYKVLKATPSSTWESIEYTRRQLVQQAHPGRVATLSPERRAQTQVDAKRANAAYEVLRQARVSNVQG